MLLWCVSVCTTQHQIKVALESLICCKGKNKAQSHTTQKLKVSRRTSPNSWRCTCWWFLNTRQRIATVLVALCCDSPPELNQSSCSYDSTTSRARLQCYTYITKQTDILWCFEIRGQLTFGYLLWKIGISLSSITRRSSGLSFSVNWMLFSLCTSLPQCSSLHLGSTSDCYCVLCI